jgi:hypothetical protein
MQGTPRACTNFREPFAFSVCDLAATRRSISNQPGGGQQSIAFKCKICAGVFDSMTAYRAHRVHRLAIGTGCADLRSMTKLTFQRRGDMPTGILREPEPLGKLLYPIHQDSFYLIGLINLITEYE